MNGESRQPDTMGASRTCKRLLCRRVSLLHLKATAIILVCIFSFLTYTYIAVPGTGHHKNGASRDNVRTNQEPELRDTQNGDETRTHLGKRQSSKVSRKSQLPKNVTRRLYIYCEMRAILTWHELQDLVLCVRVKEGEPDTKPCMVRCPNHDQQLEINLGTDLQEARTMDGILFGLSPFTMVHSFQKVLGYTPPSGQLVVFYSMENALRMHKWNSRLGIMKYHIDMTYGSYSNISIPYAYFQPYEHKNTSMVNRNWLEGKTELVAWMASNCKEVFWPRNEFITELQRFITVDTYGRCGNLTCLPRLSEKCIKMLKKYKFYLSIENSECDDYLTEKLWASALENDVIPIVYGPRKADYEKYAPPKSYIHVSDFSSVEELARYILRVAGDAKLYNSYFRWREDGTVFQKYPKLQTHYFCDVLPYLDSVPNHRTQLKDSEWFNSCRHDIKIYKRHNFTEIQRLSEWKPWK
ncbi:3-galactosyl-N-acetylglucosaminide 4-alpha-L-fucosyltransferase FUT3-like [Diadema antillarum]|uniref:3-galactosyl-N-acetylglucosaminide 4-alpha-L-fucosyltransferase FUT3-like n=1 Tax=Diadema antillarum TaxID=105358 RepID=UPI003A86B4C4